VVLISAPHSLHFVIAMKFPHVSYNLRLCPVIGLTLEVTGDETA
jgi:hypothetical protein